MTLACLACEAELPAAARFCLHCGRAVGLVDDAARRRVAAAAPPSLTARLRGVAGSGERKVVTILFADLVGSTALAERLDPEEWKAILNPALDRFAQAIYRYEGTIAQMLGDGLLAFFGAPVAHEDDPLRAVRAGLDLVAGARAYANELAEGGVELAVRVGINTGLVVLGPVGSDLRYEYLAVGDAVNLAARMQSAALPMSVLVSEATYRPIAPLLDATDRGRLELKGKAEPVQAHEIHGVRSGGVELRGVRGLHSPILGRDRELQGLLARTTWPVRAGGAVTIIGEAGMGKSRLVAEWRAASDVRVRWAVGRCVTYGQTSPFHLIADLVRTVAGDDPDDPYLRHLLGAHLDGRQIDPQTLASRYFVAVRKLVLAAAADGPLVVVLNDTHWADPSSVDVVARLLALTLEAPLLFCILTRPDHDSPGWRLVDVARSSGALELSIGPLTQVDGETLIANLLPIDALSESMCQLILTRAEGNPFFVEEIVRMLIDRGAIVRRDDQWIAVASVDAHEIPESLQGMLLARIDRLPEDAKRLAKIASVIGRELDLALLEHVVGDGAAVPTGIATLTAADLLQGSALDGRYAFRHALVQDAAYASLLRTDRRQLHAAVGTALVDLHPERADALASTIGRHFADADDAPGALLWLGRAADRARAQLALSEAAALYRSAVRFVPAVDRATEFRLRLGLADCLVQTGAPPTEIEAEIARCSDIAPDDRGRAAVQYLRGQHLHIYTALDLSEAERSYSRALSLLEREPHGELYGLVEAHLGYLYRYQHRLPESVETLERARLLVSSLGAERALAQTEIFLSGAYTEVGRMDEALAVARSGTAIAEQLGDLELIGIGHSFIVDVLLDRARSGDGDPADALPHIAEMRRYGREYGVALLGAFAEAAYADHAEQVGDLEGALVALEAGLEVLRAISPARARSYEVERGRLLLRLGRSGEAETAFAAVRATADRVGRQRVELAIARARALCGDPAAAAVSLRAALKTATPLELGLMREEIATSSRWAILRPLLVPG